MYTVHAHRAPFHHSIRLDKLPNRFQELVRDWARNLASEERYNYCWGEFYMVVPFEMLNKDTTSFPELVAFTRRFNRLHDVDNVSGIAEHVETYPYKKWRDHGESIENYLEMMFMLHHLKVNLAPEVCKPATLAVFVHD